MSTESSLLQFILNLLGDKQAQTQFNQNPQQVLHEHGFDNLCAADVHDAAPLVVDAAQQNGDFERSYSGGGPSGSAPAHTAGDPVSLPGSGGLEGAIRNIQYITDNYSYDSHNTVLDNSVNENIWAHGDVYQSIDDSPVVASGQGAVAAGGDIDHSTVTTGDHDVTGNGNATGNNDATGTGDAVGNGNAVGEGNDVNNGSGATNFGAGGSASNVGTVNASNGSGVAFGSGAASGSDPNNSTNVHNFGGGNVNVAGDGSTAAQTDSHATTTTTNTTTDTTDSNNHTDSHNTATSTTTDTTDSDNHTDSHNTTDTTTDTHTSALNEIGSHDTSTSTDTSDSNNHLDVHHVIL